MDTQWTVQMLANELLETRADLRRHMMGCEDGQKIFGAKLEVMSKKIDKVDATVNGAQRIWHFGWTVIGKVLLAVAVPVGTAVAILAFQNANLHKDTATKVDNAAQVLAIQTSRHEKALEDNQAARDKTIIDLLKNRH